MRRDVLDALATQPDLAILRSQALDVLLSRPCSHSVLSHRLKTARPHAPDAPSGVAPSLARTRLENARRTGYSPDSPIPQREGDRRAEDRRRRPRDPATARSLHAGGARGTPRIRRRTTRERLRDRRCAGGAYRPRVPVLRFGGQEADAIRPRQPRAHVPRGRHVTGSRGPSAG